MFSENEIEDFNKQNQRKKLEKQLNVEEGDKMRRERQSQLLNEIKARFVA